MLDQPAFPFAVYDQGPNGNLELREDHRGMSMVEWFASMAIGGAALRTDGSDGQAELIAQRAWAIAIAMDTQRRKLTSGKRREQAYENLNSEGR